MIAGTSLKIEIGSRTLLSEGSFVVGAGEKVGLVGKNGTGKSSLISVIVGESNSHMRHSGKVVITGTYAYLPQVALKGGLGLEATGFSHVISAKGLDVIDRALDHAKKALSEDPSEENINLFSDLEENFRVNGGYEVESNVSRLAVGLGLNESDLFEDIDSLSGGQRKRIDLIRALFQQSDTLILDEPTNHLDLTSKKWLMDELDRYRGAILMISHDLKLLDSSINKILHLSGGKLHEFKGSYSSYLNQLEADTSRKEKASATEGKEIKRLETLADSMRGSTNRRARIAKSLDKRVERLESTRTQAQKRDRKKVFKLPPPLRSGITPISSVNIEITYGSVTILKNINFELTRGDRVLVMGRNGAGKSSLLRCLTGAQTPTNGHVNYGANVEIGYFAQDHDQIDRSKSVIENLEETVLKTETERRSLLGSFGLSGGVAYQMPSTLSGGERAKLALAMIAGGVNNLLLLDEPTNNLDPASIEAVGLMLRNWSGTLIVVSHDRAFVDAFEPTHCLRLSEELFTYWREEYIEEVELRR